MQEETESGLGHEILDIIIPDPWNNAIPHLDVADGLQHEESTEASAVINDFDIYMDTLTHQPPRTRSVWISVV